MSAFQHSPDFFVRVLNALTGPECRSYTLHVSGLPYAVTSEALRAEVWRWLGVAYSAQGYAIGERYGAAKRNAFVHLSRIVPPVAVESWNMVDACKALTSILYQCDEGDTETRPEYADTLKALTRLRDCLAVNALRLHCPRWNESDAWNG